METAINITSATLARRCGEDGEFRLASRFWNGGLRLEIGATVACIKLDNGVIVKGEAASGEPGVIALAADPTVWDKLLAAKPPRFFNDIANLIGMGQMTVQAEGLIYPQYYAAVMRAIEVLRPAAWEVAARPATPKAGTHDSPVGRYVHLELQGQDYRIYYEEAGSGIPILLQHTAGGHGAQYRHLFERPEITDHFRLIAYDLPFHGKSLPPVGPSWWAEEYLLKADFLRSVPVTLAQTLGLDQPVFMGCSVGGMLALDLARHHPEVFRAVISLEGGLKVEGDPSGPGLAAFWHPQISAEYKARMMNGLMSPTSPEAYRRETMQVYASGWPPAFLGDIHYYLKDYDLRDEAHKIDTGEVAVHIMSGEYDASGTLEHGQAAHAAITGSTWTGMNDVGHFPMSENPEAFLRYLLPVLEQIKSV
jgi:pimeloyl-ACP methyl ester carboxylesterase